MNETIEFKKDIIFKTNINEVLDINLEHDYRVLDDTIEGEFSLNGIYKINETSITKEEFYYNIPFSIAISDRINKDSINLIIKDFTYDYNKDIMSIKIQLDMEYDEEITNVIDEYIEETEDRKGELIDDTMKQLEAEKQDLSFEVNNENQIEHPIVEETKQIEEIEEENINSIISNLNDKETYMTYKIHIVKEEENINTICAKYNIDERSIKDINKIENVTLGDKIIIPIIKNEE